MGGGVKGARRRRDVNEVGVGFDRRRGNPNNRRIEGGAAR